LELKGDAVAGVPPIDSERGSSCKKGENKTTEEILAKHHKKAINSKSSMNAISAI